MPKEISPCIAVKKILNEIHIFGITAVVGTADDIYIEVRTVEKFTSETSGMALQFVIVIIPHKTESVIRTSGAETCKIINLLKV